MDLLNRTLDYLQGEGRIVKTAPLAFCVLLLFGILIGFGASEFRSGAKIDALEGAVTQYQAILAAPSNARIKVPAPQAARNNWLSDLYIFVPGIAFGALIGFLIWRRPKKKEIATPTIQKDEKIQWFSTRSAMAKFVDPQTYKAMLEALNNSVENTNSLAALQNQLNNLPRRGDGRPDIMHGAYLQGYIVPLQNKIDPLNAKYTQSLTICLFDLKSKLANGILKAKAFKCPYSGSGQPDDILQSQWHALNFDMTDSDWQTVKADDVKYIGLQIAFAS